MSADVCGVLKVWNSFITPESVLDIELNGAISYNSLIEIEGLISETNDDNQNQALIAVALKSCKIAIILITVKNQSETS